MSDYTPHSLQQAIDALYAGIDARSTLDRMELSGLPTGFVDLDNLTCGLQRGELITLASYPGVGKTSLALQVVRHAVLALGKTALYFTLDQSRTEVAERHLCAHSGVDSHKLRKGHLSGADMEALIEAGDRLRHGPLFIDDRPGLALAAIEDLASAFRQRPAGLHLVVVDYVQLVEPRDRADPRQQQLAEVVRGLKALARRLEIPVLALANASRPWDRPDPRPRLSDLRETHALAEDSDTVLLLHRPELFEPGRHEGVCEVIVARQRNGPCGEVTLAFDAKTLRFADFPVEPPQYAAEGGAP